MFSPPGTPDTSYKEWCVALADFFATKKCAGIVVEIVWQKTGEVLSPEAWRSILDTARSLGRFVLVDETMTALRCGAPLAYLREKYQRAGFPDFCILSETFLKFTAFLIVARERKYCDNAREIGKIVREQLNRDEIWSGGLGAVFYLRQVDHRRTALGPDILGAGMGGNGMVRWFPVLDDRAVDLLRAEQALLRRRLVASEFRRCKDLDLITYVCMSCGNDFWGDLNKCRCKGCHRGFCPSCRRRGSTAHSCEGGEAVRVSERGRKQSRVAEQEME